MKKKSSVWAFGVLAAAATFATAAVACDGFVVGKKASATGRVIVSHNEDNLPKHRIRHAVIPAGAPLFSEPGRATIPPSDRAYACFWSEQKSDDGEPRPGDLFVNEKGVMIYSNNGGVYEEWDGETYQLPDEGYYSQCTEGGLGINLRFAVAQRARTAAEGVSILTNLVMTYGYVPLSRIFTIADKDEAWLVQVLHGRRYVARRCPDDEVAAYPNCLTIGRIQPGDICSPSIEAKRDTFDFAATYQGPRTWKSPFNVHRGLDLYRVVAGVSVEPGETYPFSLKPAHKVTAEDVKRGLSSHYEGMPYEVKEKHPEKGPKVLEPICRKSTLESMVCAFGEKPSEDVLALATGRPCETIYREFCPFGGKTPYDTVTGEAAIRWIGEHYQKTEREKVLFFVAHPDENIACAGTLFLMKDLFDIHVMVMTHGERGLGEQGYRTGQAKALRTKEEQAACDMVGAKLHWCDEIDGEAYAGRETCQKVAAFLKELKPRAVFGMWPLDFHCDHVMSAACIIKAIGLAGMRDVIELYFMEEAYDSRTFVPAHYVDVSDVMDLKREFIRKHVCQNRNDYMCKMEMLDTEMRAQRCASYHTRGYGHGERGVERFAEWDGKPQGSRCIFNELPPPKGWRQDWSAAKPSRFTPEGGMK